MLASISPEDVERICGNGALCNWSAERVDSELQLTALSWLIERPLQVLLVLMVAFVVNKVGRRVIQRSGRRLSERAATEAAQPGLASGDSDRVPRAENGRAKQRIDTLMAVLLSTFSVVVTGLAFVVVLGQFEISLAPLLAGAGVIGVAIGFGAQAVVADFLAGFFMLIEDQYGVGDIVDLGDASGTVEKFSLRTTTLRDVNGTVWHIPNHEIRRVANKSQLWSRAVVDVDVAYDTDLREAQRLILQVAEGLWQDESFDKGDIIDQPEVWGVQRLGADGITIRLVVTTDPAEQFAVARELNLRIKEAFDAHGIEIPFPQRTMWVRHLD